MKNWKYIDGAKGVKTGNKMVKYTSKADSKKEFLYDEETGDLEVWYDGKKVDSLKKAGEGWKKYIETHATKTGNAEPFDEFIKKLAKEKPELYQSLWNAGKMDALKAYYEKITGEKVGNASGIKEFNTEADLRRWCIEHQYTYTPVGGGYYRLENDKPGSSRPDLEAHVTGNGKTVGNTAYDDGVKKGKEDKKAGRLITAAGFDMHVSGFSKYSFEEKEQFKKGYYSTNDLTKDDIYKRWKTGNANYRYKGYLITKSDEDGEIIVYKPNGRDVAFRGTKSESIAKDWVDYHEVGNEKTGAEGFFKQLSDDVKEREKKDDKEIERVGNRVIEKESEMSQELKNLLKKAPEWIKEKIQYAFSHGFTIDEKDFINAIKKEVGNSKTENGLARARNAMARNASSITYDDFLRKLENAINQSRDSVSFQMYGISDETVEAWVQKAKKEGYSQYIRDVRGAEVNLND